MHCSSYQSESNHILSTGVSRIVLYHNQMTMTHEQRKRTEQNRTERKGRDKERRVKGTHKFSFLFPSGLFSPISTSTLLSGPPLFFFPPVFFSPFHRSPFPPFPPQQRCSCWYGNKGGNRWAAKRGGANEVTNDPLYHKFCPTNTHTHWYQVHALAMLLITSSISFPGLVFK